MLICKRYNVPVNPIKSAARRAAAINFYFTCFRNSGGSMSDQGRNWSTKVWSLKFFPIYFGISVRTYLKYSNTFRPLALSVSDIENIIALTSAPTRESIRTKFFLDTTKFLIFRSTSYSHMWITERDRDPSIHYRSEELAVQRYTERSRIQRDHIFDCRMCKGQWPEYL